MLGFYIKSVIVYLIIFWALKQFSKMIMFNREEINYKNYATGKKRNVLYILFYTNSKNNSYRSCTFCKFCKKRDTRKTFK